MEDGFCELSDIFGSVKVANGATFGCFVYVIHEEFFGGDIEASVFVEIEFREFFEIVIDLCCRGAHEVDEFDEFHGVICEGCGGHKE